MKEKMSVLVVLIACSAITGFAQEAISGKAELRRSLATAKTAADHARIAYYYHRTANEFARKQAEEEQIAERWERQYASWEKSPNPCQSARNLAQYYSQLASEAAAKASEQDKLARS